MINLILEDSVHTSKYDNFNVPIKETRKDSYHQVTTKDGNITTYFDTLKREWEINWQWLTASEHEELQGFYTRQFSTYRYPLATIKELGVIQVPCFLTINERNIIDENGTVKDVTITLRESGTGN